MNSMKLVIPLHFISLKKTPNDAVTPQCHSAVPVLIIFGKIYFLSITEKEFFHEIKRDGMTIFMDFMHWWPILSHTRLPPCTWLLIGFLIARATVAMATELCMSWLM